MKKYAESRAGKLITILSATIWITSHYALVAQVQPTIQWETSLGGSDIDGASSIELTFDRGYIVAAYSRSTNGQVTGNHGGFDYWIVKLDAGGNVVWQKSFGGSNDEEPACILQTPDSGYIVAGYTYSDDGDISRNHGKEDYWVIKLDQNGSLQWQKCYGGSNADEAKTIMRTSDGKYLIGGTSRSSNGDATQNHGGSDYWIVKIDESGNLIWQKSFGGSSYDVIHEIIESSDGKYVVQGYTKSIDGEVLENHGNDDMWILKLDTSGNLLWQRSYGGTYNEEGHYIAEVTDGGFVAGGYSASDDSEVAGNHGSFDYWIIRLDTIGNIIWQKCLGGNKIERSYSFQPTDDGGFVISGYSQSDDGEVLLNYGAKDYWIVKIDSSGNMVWQKTLGGSSIDVPRSIRQTADNGFIIAGASESMDGDITGNHGLQDAWIVKLSSDVVTNAEEVPNRGISFFPNPVHDYLSIVPDINSCASGQTICIYDEQGLCDVESSISPIIKPYAQIQINATGLKDGFYILQIKDNCSGKIRWGRFIKQG